MRIGYFDSSGGGSESGRSGGVLAELARRLLADGVTVRGAVQENSGPREGHCDMDLRILPDGPLIRISQDLGPHATGCRLDPAALETAVMEVERRLPGAQFLILNKFGKHEAEGRGFRQMLADVAASGVPVLVAVNPVHQRAFLDFAGELAEEVAEDRVHDWALGALAGLEAA
ncbi:MAG: DUF2478 domain-containing protein [Gemmobacter sp.]|nr:DUF2478 domain-containing protein [Gemmobacter sp.]